MLPISRFRKLLSALLVAVVLFISPILSGGAEMQALAKPMTPEAAAYEIDQADSPEAAGRKIRNEAENYKQEFKRGSNDTQQAAQDAGDSIQDKLQQAADNVREKLNLDEPLPESTKHFLDDIQGK